MTVYGGLQFAYAPEQVLLPEAVALLEFLVATAMLGLYLRVAAAVGCEDLARLPGALGGRLPVEFLADHPVDVGEVPRGPNGVTRTLPNTEMWMAVLTVETQRRNGVAISRCFRREAPWYR